MLLLTSFGTPWGRATSRPALKLPHFRHLEVSTLPTWGLRCCGFGLGDHAMWIVLFFATMVSLASLAVLAECGDMHN
jgi:hypothetical protein